MGGITRLQRSDTPEREMRERGLDPGPWSAGPGARFAPHAHHATKHLYVTAGSIEFDGIELREGEGLVIPKGMTHSAIAGPEGVSCVEAFEE